MKNQPDSTSRPLRIGYYPARNAMNAYCRNFRACLEAYGLVQDFSFKAALLQPWRLLRRLDLVCVNWLENDLIDAAGHPGWRQRWKTAFKLALLHCHAKRICFVRHNHYPHGTAPAQRACVTRLVDELEHRCAISLTHSPAEATSHRHYVPHPLYRALGAGSAPLPGADQYVAFGAIARYKNLHELIVSFPAERRLLILGPSHDKAYLAELNRLRTPNIEIRAGFVEEAQAQAIITASQGLILSHHDPSMVVSGSFFYGLSIGARVLAIRTPFLAWAQQALGDHAVITFPGVADLARSLTTLPLARGHDAPTRERIQQHFGEAAVIEHLARIFETHGMGRN